MLSFAFALGAPAKKRSAVGEVNDPIADTDLVCGAYGDPHIIRSDGNSKGHMGTPLASACSACSASA